MVEYSWSQRPFKTPRGLRECQDKMKGTVKILHKEGDRPRAYTGMTIHAVELMLDPSCVEFSLYNENSTKYVRESDGTWTRHSGSQWTGRGRKTHKVEVSMKGQNGRVVILSAKKN